MFLSVKDLEGARGGTHTTSRRKTEPGRPGAGSVGAPPPSAPGRAEV